MGTMYSFALDGVSFSHSLDTHPAKKDFEMHVHGHNEILVFISGSATYLVEGNEYPLKPGSLLLIREAESHAINFLSDEPYERFVLHFPSSALNAIDPERRLLRPFHERPLGIGNLYEASDLPRRSALSYMKAMRSTSDDTYERKIALTSHLLPLLHDICKVFDSREDVERSGGQISQIIAYINENLFENITVSSIAKEFYISVSQLERVFKQATHSSVWHYITVKRLAAAKERIDGGASATDACSECGFGDYSSFYRAYVKEYGASPYIKKRN